MKFPLYGTLGAVIMLVSQVLMLRQVEPFWSWHTPFAWTGYILFVDAWVYRRRGHSWLTAARAEFLFLAAVSIPLWLIFEWFNLFIRNWHYINLPENLGLRYFGYAWSFATIWPAIFQTGELVASFRDPGPREGRRPNLPPYGGGDKGQQPLSRAGWVSIGAGLALLLWPVLWPSPYLAAPVWLGFIFLLDPLNARAGGESLRGDMRAAGGFWPGLKARGLNLALAGLICGILWEFWNFWARTKWIYDVPILPQLKLFEMPLLGYGGFPVFALECFTMYVAARLFFWRGANRPISL
jgi:hypothetical protein